MTWKITGAVVNPDGTPSSGAIIAIVSPTPARSTSGKVVDNDRSIIPVSGGLVADNALESVPGSQWTFLLPMGRRIQIADPGDGATINLASDLPAGQPLTPDEATLLRAEITRIQSKGLKGDKGDTGPKPVVDMSGDQLTIDGAVTGPHLTGPPPKNPAFTAAASVLAAGATPTASVSGTYPNLTLSVGIPAGAKGDAGSPSAYELRGTGQPNGSVTAPVGTYYTDTAGTCGAWRWIKTAGTGNTGWAVAMGDTGWRDVSALVNQNFAKSSSNGSCHIRRIGSDVHFAMNMNVVATEYNIWTGIPMGWRGPTSAPSITETGIARQATTANSGLPANQVQWYMGGSGSTIRLVTAAPSPGTVMLTANWATGDPWPTALP